MTIVRNGNQGSEDADRRLQYPGLQAQPTQVESPGRLRRYIRRFLRAQFGRPTGFWGYVSGKVMAYTPSNMGRIRWVVSLLDIQPRDRVLEIGFGPGLAIEQINRVVSGGLVAGVDHSEVMLRQALKRNRRAVRAGQVRLELASVCNLPHFDAPFDKVFTINSIHFWVNPVDSLRRLRAFLKPGGLIAVTLQPRSRGATDETAMRIARELATNLEVAGFANVRLEMKASRSVPIACALGTNPGHETSLPARGASVPSAERTI